MRTPTREFPSGRVLWECRKNTIGAKSSTGNERPRYTLIIALRKMHVSILSPRRALTRSSTWALKSPPPSYKATVPLYGTLCKVCIPQVSQTSLHPLWCGFFSNRTDPNLSMYHKIYVSQNFRRSPRAWRAVPRHARAASCDFSPYICVFRIYSRDSCKVSRFQTHLDDLVERTLASCARVPISFFHARLSIS